MDKAKREAQVDQEKSTQKRKEEIQSNRSKCTKHIKQREKTTLWNQITIHHQKLKIQKKLGNLQTTMMTKFCMAEEKHQNQVKCH